MSDPTVPPVPESLLAPLLDAAGDVLRTLDPAEVPQSLRTLRGFHDRGMARGLARQQLLRGLETENGFRRRAVDAFLERSEVRAALEGWSASDAMARAEDAAARSDLPLLASALYAARPPGWAFGLGVLYAAAGRERAEKETGDELKALRARVEQSDEARRRAESARAEAEAHAQRAERDLRVERGSRREKEEHARRAADAVQRRADEALEEGSRLQRALEAANDRERRLTERLRATEAELRRVREESGSARVALRDEDLRALVEAARLAQRLAQGLGGVAERAEALAHATRPRGSRAGAPRAESEAPPRTAGGAPSQPKSRRRTPVRVPPGMRAEAPEALDPMLRTPGLVLLVDGYNVTMRAWPAVPPAEQRDRLLKALGGLHARTRCDITVVFDGAAVARSGAERRPGVRVLFSAENEEADAVVAREVAALPRTAPVIVVSSDQWVREHVEPEGALVLPTEAFLSALRA